MAKKLSFGESFKAQFSTKALVLIPIAVGINLIGGTLCSALKLPLFLDMIGTIVIACLSGPWVSALTGLLTNVFLAIVANPVNLPYALVSVLCGLTVGYLVKAGLFKRWWGAIVVWLVVTVVNAASASLITAFVFGGATGINGTSVLTATFVVAMQNILASVFSSSIIENLVDKGIAVFIAFIIVKKVPKRFLSQYAASRSDADDFDDGDSGDEKSGDGASMDLNEQCPDNEMIRSNIVESNVKRNASSVGIVDATGVVDAASDVIAADADGRQDDGFDILTLDDEQTAIRMVNGESGDENPIRRLNPITKIAAVFTFGIGSLLWPDLWMGAALIVVLFVVAVVAHMTGSFAKLMVGFGIPTTVMLMFMQGLYSPRNRTFIADFGFARLGLEGVMYAGKVIVTVLVFLGSFYIMNRSTYTGRMVAALTKIGLPPKVGYLVLASLNVVPQMQRRMVVVQESQSARGLKTHGGLVGRIKAIVPLLGPVILSSLTDAQERGMTLETRGFGMKGVRPTNLVQVPWRGTDRVIVWGLGLFFLTVVVVSICSYLGVLTYWSGV